MRQRHVCPKCQHNRILLAAMVPDVDDTGIRSLHVAAVKVGEGWFAGDKLERAGQLEATVCRRCGYTELYTKSPEQIPVDGTYVRELVGPEPSDPYR